MFVPVSFLLRHPAYVLLTSKYYFLHIIHICVVIKRNESEVDFDKLLVSEVLFSFNICKCVC